MDANKINNKIEIKKTLCKVLKTDLNMEIFSPGLPIFYEYPVYYINDVKSEYKNPSKPCILCNNFCSMRITIEDIPRPKLTRQTNEHLWVNCKIQNEDNMIDYFKSYKETFYEKR